MKRSEFLKTAALLGAALPHWNALAAQPGDARRVRVAIFREPGFPAGEIALPDDAFQPLASSHDLLFPDAKGLRDLAVAAEAPDLLITPYGSFFPLESYDALIALLGRGVNWLNIGGVPFARPVLHDGPKWNPGMEQNAYHRPLGIIQAYRVRVGSASSAVETEGVVGDLQVHASFELVLRFASTPDIRDEEGSPGEREAEITPLVRHTLTDKKRFGGRPMACSVVAIDRLLGDFAGGRWVLANFEGAISASGIVKLAVRALEGAATLTAAPAFACFRESERPSLHIGLRRPHGDAGRFIERKCTVEVSDADGRLVEQTAVRLSGEGTIAGGTCILSAGRKEGLYRVKLRLPRDGGGEVAGESGFRIGEPNALGRGAALTAGSDFLLRDGSPWPVHGTTYMASDAQRKFLFDADPARWDRDMLDMKRGGINMLRTGLWSGWKSVMPEVGVIPEGILRSLDAFFLTAHAHDLPVIFTFFAFLPESWGGANPYLDPRSVAAQEAFILAIVQRYRGAKGILWDLINEPSFCNPAKLWSCRPNYDRYEAAAWRRWLLEKYPASGDLEHLARLREVFRTAASDAAALPSERDFDEVNFFEDRSPLKALDYRLFAQEMFAQWASHMADLIRKNAPGQLVTVGQDEGGTSDRPSPQFFAPAVDVTSVHSWWFNDDLVWDNVMTRVPGKPHLVEETGVMYYERTDGMPYRSEEESAALLDRKLAVAFGAGGAGFVEWLWHTNPYMPSDNEAAIGLLRADGTAKPELEVVLRYAGFYQAHRALLTEREPNGVWLVIPHAGIFTPRGAGGEATRRAVRLLSSQCNAQPSAVSEFRLAGAVPSARLLVIPSVRGLSEKAWQSILATAEHGSSVLVTGILDADEHLLPVDRTRAVGLTKESETKRMNVKPISPEEFLYRDRGEKYRLGFRGDKLGRLEKPDIDLDVRSVKHGAGTIFWSPLPIELSDDEEVCAQFYQNIVEGAGVPTPIRLENSNGSVLLLTSTFKSVIAVNLISLGTAPRTVRLLHTPTMTYKPADAVPGWSALILFDRTEGTIVAHG